MVNCAIFEITGVYHHLGPTTLTPLKTAFHESFFPTPTCQAINPGSGTWNGELGEFGWEKLFSKKKLWVFIGFFVVYSRGITPLHFLKGCIVDIS